MDERLLTLASLVPHCRSAADVGADHGKLGAHLLKTGVCEFVYLTDISAPSLEKARRLVRREGLEDRCALLVGDGLTVLPPFDAAVIAGMGAPTIEHILTAGQDRIGDAKLILEPNVGAEELRLYLCRNGFAIEDEALTRAGGRWYVCMRAGRGRMPLTPEEALAGPVLLARKDPALPGYRDFRVRVAKKALSGAQGRDETAARELTRELTLWEEVSRRIDPCS